MRKGTARAAMIPMLLTGVISACAAGNTEVGSVVTKAKTGFGNSVFESAGDKCQHCHYDLYNTWRESMHSQSWSNQIFQNLFQGYFTELMVNKIGVAGPTGTINAKTAEKMAAVCLTCHAPGAYYSQDFSITISEASAGDSGYNLAPNYNPQSSATVVATAPAKDGKTYKATYQIGHKNNLEGINCAFCHSIEKVRMIQGGDTYTLAGAIKTAPAIGDVIYPPGAMLSFSPDSGSAHMNAFFQITGPEIHGDYANTRGSKLGADGRYLMKSIPLTDEGAGKIHHAGGPYYGPYGVYGLHNDSSEDQTNRHALLDPAYTSPDNHFEDKGKAICLACHQRSAKVLDPQTGASRFMELCTTWSVTNDNLLQPGQSPSAAASPKCQKCHMEKLNGLPVNEWYLPGVAADMSGAPQAMQDNTKSKVFHNHKFEGGTVPAKIKAAFSTEMSARKDGAVVSVYTSLLNKTAHMLPEAHPMRRMLTMVRVKDATGANMPLLGASIATDYEDVNYTYTGANTAGPVALTLPKKGGNPPYMFAGFVNTPNGGVGSQWFAKGSNRIVEDGAVDRFVRIYGRESIDAASGNVKAGFASNSAVDNRLQPNERESFNISFNASAASGAVTVVYKVYYMRKGASGAFPLDSSGFLDNTANSSNMIGITEVASYSFTVK